MSNHYSSFDSEQHLLDKVELFSGITIVWKRRSRRGHDRANFSSSISVYPQPACFAKSSYVMKKLTPSGLQGYDISMVLYAILVQITKYGKICVIVLF